MKRYSPIRGFSRMDEAPPYKNPKEGRSLGDEPDGDPLVTTPGNFPLGADLEVENSIAGKTENEKTFHQSDDYWSDRGHGGGIFNDNEDEDDPPSLEEKKP